MEEECGVGGSSCVGEKVESGHWEEERNGHREVCEEEQAQGMKLKLLTFKDGFMKTIFEMLAVFTKLTVP